MTVPLALQQPELRRFPLRAVRVPAAGGTYRFVAPRSSADLLARAGRAGIARAERGDHPYWADVWPASIALFRVVMRGASLAGCTAIDLGCGIGLPGTGAGLRGARVLYADREPDALHFATFNGRTLGVADCEACQLDWERDPLPDAVDLLLLADLAYQYRNVRALLRHSEAVLARDGRVLCADPERPTATDLFSALVGLGARVTHCRAENPQGGGRSTIRIADVGGGSA